LSATTPQQAAQTVTPLESECLTIFYANGVLPPECSELFK
jgi:hypothetical protein